MTHSHPTLAHLFAVPERFEFFQTVRLISMMAAYQNKPANKPILPNSSDGSLPTLLRFRSMLSLSFPISDISEIRWLADESTEQAKVELTVTLGGLYGPQGLLPRHYTELIIERQQAKDPALRDFLDMFNQRLFSLLYQAWEKNHFHIAHERTQLTGQQPDLFTLMLFSLTGQGQASLQQRPPIADEAILFYAGAFADKQRSAHLLQNMLSDLFELPVEIEQAVPKQIILSTEKRSRLGDKNSAQHNRLSVNTILGQGIWLYQHHLCLNLGPLSYRQYKTFFPNAKNFNLLTHFTRRYLGLGITFEVKLILLAPEIPFCQLGLKTRLGYDSWLEGQSRINHAANAIFSSTQ